MLEDGTGNRLIDPLIWAWPACVRMILGEAGATLNGNCDVEYLDTDCS